MSLPGTAMPTGNDATIFVKKMEGVAMKRHYVVQAIMSDWNSQFQCPMGAVCELDELGDILKKKAVSKYKLKSIDGDLVQNWKDTDWIDTGLEVDTAYFATGFRASPGW